MKKWIIFLTLFPALSYSQFDRGHRPQDTLVISQIDTIYSIPTPLVFGNNTVSAEGGASASLTVDAEVGYAEVTSQSTMNGNSFELTINDSLVTATSYILISLFGTITQTVTPYISIVDGGGFFVVQIRNDAGGNWTDDFRIYFRVYNND
jgi:hypothetical protein